MFVGLVESIIKSYISEVFQIYNNYGISYNSKIIVATYYLYYDCDKVIPTYEEHREYLIPTRSRYTDAQLNWFDSLLDAYNKKNPDFNVPKPV